MNWKVELWEVRNLNEVSGDRTLAGTEAAAVTLMGAVVTRWGGGRHLGG